MDNQSRAKGAALEASYFGLCAATEDKKGKGQNLGPSSKKARNRSFQEGG